MTETKTPTLEKMAAVRETSQGIGEFLDWLHESQSLHLMAYRTDQIDTRPCPGDGGWLGDPCDDGVMYLGKPNERDCTNCDGKGYIEVKVEGWVEDPRSIEQLLADYFEIDLKAVEKERRALLEEIRRAQDGEG
jgi:hypothetical protein